MSRIRTPTAYCSMLIPRSANYSGTDLVLLAR
jgi:hypothetical protein